MRFTLLSHTLRSFNSRYTIVQAVLKEVLRIFPSAPLIGRTSRDDPLVIPSTSNLYLPPKTQIMMVSLLAHKRADLWGPDAEVFRPERWFESAVLDKIAKTPFMYSPFYGGPRAVSSPNLSSFLLSIDDNLKKILVFGTRIRAESSGLLHRAPLTTIQLLHPRTRFHARGIVATRSLGGNAGSSRCGEDPPGDQLYDAQQGAWWWCWAFVASFTSSVVFGPLMLRRRFPSGFSIYRVAFGYLPNPRLRLRLNQHHLKFLLRLLPKRRLPPRWRRPRIGEAFLLLSRARAGLFHIHAHAREDGRVWRPFVFEKESKGKERKNER